MATKLRYLIVGWLTVNAAAIPIRAQTPAHSSEPSQMMFLANILAPFVDRNLAAQLGRDVIAAKYPMAALSSDAPQVVDQGDTWVVTVGVDHWTQGAELFGGIKAIPVSIRKKDAAIVDIFTHGFVVAAPSDAMRKMLATDDACKKCHHSGENSTGVK